ncbi:DNA ligase 1 [Narcine bancroftii]|uniref:DNA ligase 1 n=1 Tax=Narcine bancroftii TaxID=1343680 RepID=UPI00383191CA
MQRSIASFFQPLDGVRRLHGGEHKPNAQRFSKSPLKPRNVQSTEEPGESPVKRVACRLGHVIDSDEEEEGPGDVEKQEVPERGSGSPPADVGEPRGRRTPSPPSDGTSVTQLSPSDAPADPPRRRTARKQFGVKRKSEGARWEEGGREEQDGKAKRRCVEVKEERSPEMETGIGLQGPSSGQAENRVQLGDKEKEALCEQQEIGGDFVHGEGVEVEERQKESPRRVDPQERGEGLGASQEKAAGKGSVSSGVGDVGKEEEKSKASINSFFAPRKSCSKQESKVNNSNSPSQATKSSVNGSFLPLRGSVEQTGARIYCPTRLHYHPIEDACWSPGQRVPYLAVAITFEKIEGESARLRNVETLSNLLRSVIALSPDDLLPCIYLCLNQLGPAYLGLELGVGEFLLIKAVAQATGRHVDRVKQEAQEKGDLGLVAESSRSTQRTMFTPAPLTLHAVHSKLKEIAHLTGSASMNKKMEVIKGLLVACRQSEARYLVRSLEGKLRIGLAEQSVLTAIAQAVCLTPPGQGVLDAGKGMSAESRRSWIEEKTLLLKQTYCEMPNYEMIVRVLLKDGIDELPRQCHLTPGIPLKPMLAHPTRGIDQVLSRFEAATFVCEYKYDGERAQIHLLESGEVHIYSRNQENNTSKYPDIVRRMDKVRMPHVRSCVLDTEAVAWDVKKQQIQPFQVLTTRKRKDVDAANITVQVCVYAFDLLFLNGESLVKAPFSRRRKLLRDSFVEVEGEFIFAQSMISGNTEDIAEFLEQSIRDSCEGLMVKTLDMDATYEIAKRSHNWLKLKKDYLEGVGDSLDLVVIGAFHGRGKRAGLYGGFLLACFQEDDEEFQSICKIGTGFKDEELEQHAQF